MAKYETFSVTLHPAELDRAPSSRTRDDHVLVIVCRPGPVAVQDEQASLLGLLRCFVQSVNSEAPRSRSRPAFALDLSSPSSSADPCRALSIPDSVAKSPLDVFN